MKHTLRSTQQLAIQLDASHQETMLFVHPFAEIADWRATRGMETEIRLGDDHHTHIDLYSMFLPHTAIPHEPFKSIITIKPDGKTPCVEDYRKQLFIEPAMRKINHPPLHFFSNTRNGSLYMTRRRNPLTPYIGREFPMRVVFLPPTSKQSLLDYTLDSFLWKKTFTESVRMIVDAGHQVLLPEAYDSNGMWNYESAWQLYENATVFPCQNIAQLGSQLLCSSMVVAFESEYSLLSSMLSIPTLTIYAPGNRSKRFRLDDKALPAFSVNVDEVSKAHGEHVLAKFRQVQSILFSVC